MINPETALLQIIDGDARPVACLEWADWDMIDVYNADMDTIELSITKDQLFDAIKRGVFR